MGGVDKPRAAPAQRVRAPQDVEDLGAALRGAGGVVMQNEDVAPGCVPERTMPRLKRRVVVRAERRADLAEVLLRRWRQRRPVEDAPPPQPADDARGAARAVEPGAQCRARPVEQEEEEANQRQQRLHVDEPARVGRQRGGVDDGGDLAFGAVQSGRAVLEHPSVHVEVCAQDIDRGRVRAKAQRLVGGRDVDLQLRDVRRQPGLQLFVLRADAAAVPQDQDLLEDGAVRRRQADAEGVVNIAGEAECGLIPGRLPAMVAELPLALPQARLTERDLLRRRGIRVPRVAQPDRGQRDLVIIK